MLTVLRKGSPLSSWMFLSCWLCLGAAHADHTDLSQLLVPEGQLIENTQELLALQLGRFGSLAFSHDGQLLASATADGRVCLWSLTSGHPSRCFRRTDEKTLAVAPLLAWSRGDERIAAGFPDSRVEVWPISSSREAITCQFAAQPEGLSLGLMTTSLRFTEPANDLLVVGSKNGNIRTCRTGATRAEDSVALQYQPLGWRREFLFQRSAMDAKGELLAVAKDRTLGVWLLGSGQLRWFKPALPSLVRALTMSHDGRLLAAGLLDGSVSIWEVATGTERRLPPHHREAVRVLAFSQDGRQLAAGADDTRVSIWDIDASALKRELPGMAAIDTLAFGPDGTMLAVPDETGGILLWNTETGSLIRTLTTNAQPVGNIAFSPKGDLLATASDDARVRLWAQSRVGSGPTWSRGCTTTPLPGAVRTLAFQPPWGRQLAIAADSGMVHVLTTDDCSAPIPIRALDDEGQGWVRSLAFSSTGDRLAFGTKGGFIGFWDTQAQPWKHMLNKRAHADEIRVLAFVPPEGRFLVSASLDRTVSLWELPSVTKLYSFPKQAEGVKAIDVSPDGSLLAMAVGKEVSIWELGSRKLRGSLTVEQRVTAVRFSPDGKLLATTTDSGRLELWDALSVKSEAALVTTDVQTGMGAVDFASQGDLLATAAVGRVNLWNYAKRTLHAQLWQGGDDWAVIMPKAAGSVLFRRETGNLIWKQRPDGSIAPLLPPKATPQLTVEVDHFKESTDHGQLGLLTVRLTNTSAAAPAYWVRVEGVDLPGRHDLRDRVLLKIQPVTAMRIDPGQSVEMELTLSAKQHGLLPPRTVSFCLVASDAYDEQSTTSCSGPHALIPPISLGPWWWKQMDALLLVAALICLLLLVPGAYLFYKYYRRALSHPVVCAALAGQNPLLNVKLRQIAAAQIAMSRVSRFPRTRGLLRRALRAANIDEHGWQRAQHAITSADACATAFAESIGVHRENLPKSLHRTADLAVFSLHPPPLSIYIPYDTVLIVCTSRRMTPQNAVAQCRAEDFCRPRFALLLDLTQSDPAQTAIEVRLALKDSHPGTTFVLISEEGLTRILLARDELKAKELLCHNIVEQCELRQIVPYRDGGNEIPAEQGSFFFGRRAELDQMMLLRQHNFLLIGPRSMGKSSLLNALCWELNRRYPQLQIIKHQLFTGNLRSLQIEHPALCADTPEAFYESVMARSDEHQIFLLDEADPLIAEEKKSQYPFCSVMRALSGQGRASFVLTGHQELYEATRTPDHPLRNFGELIRLEPLDRSSTKRMILDPITALGLRFSEEDQTVAWLCDQTGCRPHLLAILCWTIVNLRGSLNPAPISLAEVQSAVLSRKILQDAFGGWNDENIHALDRAVARTALLLDRPRLDEVMSFLHAQGVFSTEEELEQSLTRLYVWYYVLIADATGRLFCPIALFRCWLTDPRPEFTEGVEWRSADERLRAELERDLNILRTLGPSRGEISLEFSALTLLS